MDTPQVANGRCSYRRRGGRRSRRSAVADVRLGQQVVDQRVDLRPVRRDGRAVTPGLDQIELQVGVDDVRGRPVELAVLKRRAAVAPSSWAETPRMWRAACAGPRLAPYTELHTGSGDGAPLAERVRSAAAVLKDGPESATGSAPVQPQPGAQRP